MEKVRLAKAGLAKADLAQDRSEHIRPSAASVRLQEARPPAATETFTQASDRWIELLRCPDCGEKFTSKETSSEGQRQEERGVYGILQCSCFRYPVVDGVPIILKGHVGLIHQGGRFEFKGPEVAEITRLVEEGRGFEALIRCLAFTPRFGLLDRLPGWRFWHGQFVSDLTRKWIEKRLRRMLSHGRERLYAEDWFEFYFGSHTASEANHLPYYRNRFAFPRTIASHALLQLLPSSEKPILDLGCGYGPFPHYLTRRRDPASVIGLDFNFYLTWGQKHWIAPDATFVCADGNKRLPFADDTFSGVFCSDTFMYLHDRPTVIAEFKRCAPSKPVILARVGNRKVSPREVWGDPCSIEEYMELLSWGAPRIFGDHALVRHYLERRNPLAAAPTDPKDLRWDKWLYFALNTQGLEKAQVDPSGEWPHQVGELTFNPIFERKTLPGGKLKLDFEFPALWVAYQNADMYSYHADKLECSADAPARARAGQIDAEVQELLDRFVLIGLPERYLRPRE